MATTDATFSLMIFLTITVIYFIVKYNFSTHSNMQVYTLIYFLTVIITQYFINLNVINSRCGTTNWSLALMVTFIPWMFIFGLLNVMLLQFPGWKSPFSNTFGYIFAILLGVKSLLIDKILKYEYVNEFTPDNNTKQIPLRNQNGQNGQNGGNNHANEVVQHIYSNPSLLINEITPLNFEAFWKRMTPLFKPDAKQYKLQLYKMIELKDIVSEFMWFLLTGGLITSISYNYMSTAKCSINATEMKSRNDDYESDLSKISTKESKIYISND